MLCPEVWNFKAPHSNFKVRKGNLGEDTASDNIRKFPFNHLISVTLPDTSKVPQDLTDALLVDCEYYKISNLPLSEIVSSKFISAFIKKGYLTALSVDSRIDCDNCVSLNPNKVLVLSLNKETYQSLGIQGKVSPFNKRTRSRYIVKICLDSDSFAPGKPNYEKVKLGLAKLGRFKILLNWEPYDENVCPSSIAKYFHDLGYDVKLSQPQHTTHTEYSVKVPNVNIRSFEFDDALDFVEWLGMINLQCDLESGAVDSFITTYETPEPFISLGQVKMLQWRGFYTATQIQAFFARLKNFVKAENKLWAALYVQGFSDLPENWINRAHNFYTNGDDSYTFVLTKEDFLLFTQSCSNKQYK